MLYARGLSTLAELGDLAATRELADVISLIAQARRRATDELAEAIWQAGAIAVGWGAERAVSSREGTRAGAGSGGASALLEAARIRRQPAIAGGMLATAPSGAR